MVFLVSPSILSLPSSSCLHIPVLAHPPLSLLFACLLSCPWGFIFSFAFPDLPLFCLSLPRPFRHLFICWVFFVPVPPTYLYLHLACLLAVCVPVVCHFNSPLVCRPVYHLLIRCVFSFWSYQTHPSCSLCLPGLFCLITNRPPHQPSPPPPPHTHTTLSSVIKTNKQMSRAITSAADVILT